MTLEISEQTITFGPFVTEHFQRHADERMREWFLGQITVDIIPQLTGPVLSVKGRVYSDYDKERHVGPYSIVKFAYEFDLEFTSADETERVQGSIDLREVGQPLNCWLRIDNVRTRKEATELKERELAALRATADHDITIGDPRFDLVPYAVQYASGARTLEEGTTFGPFQTEYFQHAVDDQFRADLFAFVRSHIVPRIRGKEPVIKGEVYAPYDQDRHLGPMSVLKNRYQVWFSFISPEGEESVSGRLIYDRASGSFSPGREKLHWDSASDNASSARMRNRVARIAYRYNQGQRKILCPFCGNGLLEFDCNEGDDWGYFNCRAADRCIFKGSITLEAPVVVGQAEASE